MKHKYPRWLGAAWTPIPAGQLKGLVARFEPHRCSYRGSLRSSALLITLIIMTLITILVIAFLGLASQDLKSTYFYVRSDQADQIARAGLDFVIGNLQGEIEDPNLSTTNFGTVQSPFYVPTSGTYAFPMRMVANSASTTNILLCSSNSSFYTSGLAPSTKSSAIASTNISLNNQVITVTDWNKPMLVPGAQTASMPIPNWIFISRNGPVSLSPTQVSSTFSPSLTNPNAVIGRYAFMVYDTSGLLDINVAGYDSTQPSMATNAAGKGLLPYADLTQLPGINTNDVNALVQFRNAISETNYPLALANTNGYGLESNGFMQVYTPATNGPSDSTFLSRQELIQYASNNPDWSNALPYLTTFSRELNGPTWGPATNLGTVNGTNYNYQNLATNTATATALTTINPNACAVRVPALWAGGGTRNNGLPWIAGDPLVKYRFPLDKLVLLESVGTTYTYSDWAANKDNIQANIQKYFGLDLVSDSNGLYRHWQYPTQSPKYLHANGQVLTLAQVAALTTPREPDFFELLQAGILVGSLGGYGRADASQNPTDYDTKATVQIMRIGANIICQWKADSYPTTITYLNNSGGSIDVYGAVDLPYITQMFAKAYSPKGNLSVPVLPYIYFQVWNPHQPPSTYNPANYPSSLRVVPFCFNPPGGSTHIMAYSDNFTLFIAAEPAGYSSGIFKWNYDQTLGFSTNSGGTNFFTLATTYGGGFETNSSAGLLYTPFNPATDYREPGLLVGTPHPVLNYNSTNPPAAWNPGSSLGGGSPSGQLAAISLPAIPYFPPTNQWANTIPSKYNGSANTNNIPWSTSFTTSNIWRFGFASQTVFAQQFMDANGAWHTYGTFEGVDAQTPTSLASFSGWNTSGWWVPGTSTSPNDVSWSKPDPRTSRFGAGNIGQQSVVTSSSATITAVTNAATPPLLNPNSTLANIAWLTFGTSPFQDSSTAASPFRMDYWAVNNPNKPVQGPYYSGNNSPYIADLDSAVRGADSAYAYSSSGTWGSNPLVPGGTGSAYQSAALPGRPVMLNHPFHSVGDLGYAYRDDPFRTLDFMTPGSADAGLLDIFNLSEAPVVAGRINPNTPYANVIAALVSGATQSSLTPTNSVVPAATVPATTAQQVAAQFVGLTPTTPITSRASLVTGGAVSNIINDGYFSDNGSASLVKTEGESLVRSLAESSNTRTWNLLIDVIGQSGHFVNNSALVTSGGKDNFVVDGERRYWLLIAIDRYTGKIVDQQLEIVDQ